MDTNVSEVLRGELLWALCGDVSVPAHVAAMGSAEAAAYDAADWLMHHFDDGDYEKFGDHYDVYSAILTYLEYTMAQDADNESNSDN